MKEKILLKIIVSTIGTITAFIFPMILYYYSGIKNSLSSYVIENNIFNYSLIIIACSLLINRKYWICSLFILMIVYFDVVSFPRTHNVIAGILFFLFTLLFFIEKKYVYFILMVSSISIFFYNLLIFEILAIITIVIYNIEIIYRVIKIEYLNKKEGDM